MNTYKEMVMARICRDFMPTIVYWGLWHITLAIPLHDYTYAHLDTTMRHIATCIPSMTYTLEKSANNAATIRMTFSDSDLYVVDRLWEG